jgi:hypothetical protein
MAGSTIDHLISVMVFLGALLVFISLFNQTLQTAVLYQRHKSLATKCSDLLDNMLVNTGSPVNWGKSGAFPVVFGLQDPEFQQYVLSPFSLMRLLSSAGDKVYYNGTWYSNVSWDVNGGYFLIKESECINYSLAFKLLGVNGTYGFQLAITPTVNVNIVEDESVSDHLKLNITVMGQGSPLAGASIDYLMFWASSSQSGQISNTTRTNALGFVSLDFNEIDISQNRTAYTFIAQVSLSGLRGVGYLSRNVVLEAGNVVPYIESLNGTILLVHNPGRTMTALHFNATFYVLPDNFSPISVLNVSGLVNHGQGKPFYTIQIPTNATGFLVVSYRTGNDIGMAVMPWGIGVIGLSVVFGGDPSGQEWVATDMRQVIVNGVAYQARLALWSLEGYRLVG